ncbi:MAG: efflux RND transporter periplasmic adaptor subunit [Thermoanaerobaculum sp.]|nr:efflux RND transporter periplasmic adaptor subunit [Thermoanaerobaculum sp.]
MRGKVWLVALLAVVALVVLWVWWGQGGPVVAVETVTVSRGVVEEIVTNTRAGTVKARLRSKLSPQTGGLVVALPHREGEWVEAGALVLKLDDQVQRAQWELAERQLKAAQSRAREACEAAELARRERGRGETLAEEGVISAQTLDLLVSRFEQAQASCVAAQALVEQAQAQVRLAQAQWALTELRAPFAGVIAELATEVGEWITPSPPGVPLPPVIDLLQPNSLYVVAPIDELDVGRVRLGQEVRISVDPRPGVSFAGRVARISNYILDVAEQNRTADVEVVLEAGQDLAGVLPGASADVEIVISRKEQVLRIPTSAIGEGKKVLVLRGGRLAERNVEVGLANWQFTEVVQGLVEGEHVVVSRDRPEVKPGVRAKAS